MTDTFLILKRLSRVFSAALLAALPVAASEAEGLDFFEKHVRPLLANKCQACHNAQLTSGNIDLSGVEGFVKARDEAALISAHDPESSRLLAIVGYKTRVKMPPGGKLGADEIKILRDWVLQGAPWPGAERREAMIPDRQQGTFTEEQRNYWAFRPLAKPDLPAVGKRDWTRNAIDRFVLARLERAGLEPAPPADRLTWLRRATFDLTGLPPSPEDARAFLEDEPPEAYERVVERLLASPSLRSALGPPLARCRALRRLDRQR